jgi:putative transposase
MKKSTCTEEEITYALRQVEAGTPAAEVCRKLGVSEQTFYRWKDRRSGPKPPRVDCPAEANRGIAALALDCSRDVQAEPGVPSIPCWCSPQQGRARRGWRASTLIRHPPFALTDPLFRRTRGATEQLTA